MTGVPLGAVAMGAEAALTVERTTSGAVRVTCPIAPGWAATARTPRELATVLEEGWREADVAAYAQRKAEPYDLAAHDLAAHTLSFTCETLPPDPERRAAAIAEAVGRATVPTKNDPLAWSPQGDGTWISPSGRRFGGQTQVVQRVIALRQSMGVDTQPVDGLKV